MNTNYLKGMKCPQCGSEGPFSIRYSTWILTYDDGVEDNYNNDIDHNDDSACNCSNCDYEGPIHTFKTPAS